MQWGSVSEFFAMGGYGLYVWGSYVVAAVGLGAEVLLVRRRARTSGAVTGRRAVARTSR
jgi:heme exporter protein D